MLFFTVNIFQILVDYININATLWYNLYLEENLREWIPVIINDIRIFIVIVIYIGLERKTNVKDYWRTPIRHDPMRRMSLKRYEQIKRFFYVSNPYIDLITPEEKKHK
jgi:hypothetical protein